MTGDKEAFSFLIYNTELLLTLSYFGFIDLILHECRFSLHICAVPCMCNKCVVKIVIKIGIKLWLTWQSNGSTHVKFSGRTDTWWFSVSPFLSAISTAKNLGKENGQVHQPILEGQVLPHKSASKLTPLSLSSAPWVLCPLLLNTKSLLYSCAFFLRKRQSGLWWRSL